MTYSSEFLSPASEFLCSWVLPVGVAIFVCMVLFFFGTTILRVFLDAFGKDSPSSRATMEWKAIDDLKGRVASLEARMDDIAGSGGAWTRTEKR